jgi:hypothetical protein
MYCVIKCVKTKRVLKGNFASSVFHCCNPKTQKTQICITGPKCVKTDCFYNVQCIQKVTVHLQTVLEVMSMSIYTGLNHLIVFANTLCRSA